MQQASSNPVVIPELAPLLRRLERNSSYNRQLTLIVLAGWTVLFCFMALMRGEIQGELVIVVATSGLLFWRTNKVSKHIYNYAQPKATDMRIVSKWIRDYWIRFIVSLCISVGVALFIGFEVGIVATWIAAYVFPKTLLSPLALEYEAGTRPLPYEWIRDDYDVKRAASDPGVFFGGLQLPTSEATTHFKIIGTSGSGKTNVLRLFMQSVLTGGRPDVQNRALIHDPKSEFVPLLVGMGVEQSRIRILNIFDDRAYAWDLAKDLTRERDALSLVKLLLPEKEGGNGNNEFFEKAARRILSGVTRFFIRYAPGVWTLRDLVLAVQHLEFTTALLTQDKKLQRSLQALGSGETVGNVMSTISAFIGDELEIIAAYSDYAMQNGRTFTLEEWFRDGLILMLGCDRESEATLRPFNQLFFTRAAQLLTSRNSRDSSMSFVILDELPAMGKLGKIEEVAKLGRSYNVSLTVAFQAYSDLEHIYGEKIANSLIGQFDKSAYLRALDFQTAEWASKQIGNMKVTWRARNESRGVTMSFPMSSSSHSSGYGQQRENDPVVRPDDIMNIPKPSLDTKTGVKGFYRVDHYCYTHEMSSEFLTQNMRQEDKNVKDLIAAPDIAEDLRLWDDEDIQRLDIGAVLASFESEKLQMLPVEDWVQLEATSEVVDLFADLGDEKSLEN